MPLLIQGLLGALIQGAGTLVGKVLISLGIGYVTYTGIGLLFSTVKQDALAAIANLPPAAFQLMGVLQIGTCINILASAALAKLALRGLTNGAITKMIQK